MTDALATVASLRRRLEDTLRPLLKGVERYALIDFPNYPNVGDSAIYLGELACLRSLGLPAPRYTCDFRSYDREVLARRLGAEGVILLAGGGSFGDLWPTAQAMREDIACSFPRHRIVQLPQTIHFEHPDALRRAKRALDAHPDFTLLVRDRRSLEIAANEFRAPRVLCPDMAFALGPLQRTGLPHEAVLCLLRTDKESAFGASAVNGASVGSAPGAPTACAARADWIDEPPTLLRSASWHLIDAIRAKRFAPLARSVLTSLYEPLARQRLARGVALLSSARVVVTDRLHGHILSLLLGVPHVVLDNGYGKLSSFHDTWTRGADIVSWAASPPEALQLAAAMAGSAASPTASLPTTARP